MKMKSLLLLGAAAIAGAAYAETYTSVITPLEGEKWWGAGTFFGSHMPYDNFAEKDLSKSNYSNQSAPLFVSSKGRKRKPPGELRRRARNVFSMPQGRRPSKFFRQLRVLFFRIRS